MKVFRIQQPGSPNGAALGPWGFLDSPDCEVLVGGYATRIKDAIAVARQANYLQWGFTAPPNEMTPSGKALFANCIVYISRHDGRRQTFSATMSPRSTLVPIIVNELQKAKTQQDNGFPPTNACIDKAILQQHQGEDLLRYAKANEELIYCIGYTFYIDQELQALGITSNRKIETLQTLIAMLSDPKQAPIATKLLKRYTTETFTTADEWQSWLNNARQTLYFTDAGGYKFRIEEPRIPR